jgi:hypothetical protein
MSLEDEEDDTLAMRDCVNLGKHLVDAAVAYLQALKVRDYELDLRDLLRPGHG